MVTTHTSILGTYYGVLTEMGVDYDTSGSNMSGTRLPCPLAALQLDTPLIVVQVIGGGNV